MGSGTNSDNDTKSPPSGPGKRVREISDLREIFFPYHFPNSESRSPAPKMIKREPAETHTQSEPLITIPLSTFEDVANQAKSESNSNRSASKSKPPAFEKIRIKKEKDLRSSSEEEDGSSGDDGSDSTPSQESPCNAITPTVNNLVQFGAGVYFSSTPSVKPPPTSRRNQVWRPHREIFCYNCKRYGHLKRSCTLNWYHWWPCDYLNRHPWLKRRVQNIRHLRMKGKWDEYRIAAMRLEKEVEEAELASTTPENQNRYWTPLAREECNRQPRRENILQAKRRCSPNQSTNSRKPLGNLTQKFEFDCHKLIENLQTQIEYLRLTLMNQSDVSPFRPPANIPSQSFRR